MPLIPSGLSQALFERLKDRVKRELGLEPAGSAEPTEPGGKPVAEPQSTPPSSNEEKKLRIQEAGRKRVLLLMQYNGIYRHVEPYSYRFRDKDNANEPLLYAFCHKDQGIEAFKLRKITDLQVTDQPFSPRYPVEF